MADRQPEVVYVGGRQGVGDRNLQVSWRGHVAWSLLYVGLQDNFSKGGVTIFHWCQPRRGGLQSFGRQTIWATVNWATHRPVDCRPDGLSPKWPYTAGNAGDTSPPIFWLEGRQWEYPHQYYYVTFGYSRPILVVLTQWQHLMMSFIHCFARKSTICHKIDPSPTGAQK